MNLDKHIDQSLHGLIATDPLLPCGSRRIDFPLRNV